jgi:HSP20 family molecular chaperone IbpA
MTTFIHNQENDYTGPQHPHSPSLLQLLNNFAHHLSSHNFYPRFDIEEHEHTYELYGDLPGAEKASLTIATLDEHTIEISGSTARHPTETSGLAKGEDGSVPNVVSSESVAVTQQNPSSPPTLAAAHAEQLAVEHSNGKPAPAVDDAPDGGELTKTHCHKEAKPAKEMKFRYLTRERQNGEFHRFFPFINAIKEKEVTASFHNGVLHVTVPKGPAIEKNHVEIHYRG